MDKRLLIVLPLCLVILLGWSVLSTKLGWTPPPSPPPTATPTLPANPDKDAPRVGDAAATAGTPAAKPPQDEPLLGARIVDTEERTETITFGAPGQPGYYRALFTNKGGALAELRTGNHVDHAGLSAEQRADPGHWRVLVGETNGGKIAPSFLLRAGPSSTALTREPLESALWKMERIDGAGSASGVQFTLATGGGVTFVKRFLFEPGQDRIRFELALANEGFTETGGFKGFVITPAAGIPLDSGDTFYPEPQAIAVSHPPSESSPVSKAALPQHSGEPRTGALSSRPPLVFAGSYNKYFAVLFAPADDAARAALTSASWRAVHDEDWLGRHPGKAGEAWRRLEVDIDLQIAVPAVGASQTWRFDAYAGAKQDDVLKAANPAFVAVIDEDLGFTRPIAKVLLAILNAFHWMTSSWGVAIILLTFTVRLVLFPLNRRSQTAMSRYQAKMKRIQPRIDEVKKRYEKDPAKLRSEQARIMQEEGAFPPLGGCLPPLLQIPVFIGLFRAIGVSFDLRHTPFLGLIQDLSLPDQLLPIDANLPLIGHVAAINLLPPIMVAMSIWQQRMMPMPTDEQAKTMYKMMMWMPIVMGFVLYNYAAGLSLYMITQSGLGVFEQKVIRKYWPVDDKEIPKKKDGFFSKLMAAQNERMKQLESQKRAKSRV